MGKIGKIWSILRGGDESPAAAPSPGYDPYAYASPPLPPAPPQPEPRQTAEWAAVPAQAPPPSASPPVFPANPPYRADAPDDGTVFYQGVDVGKFNVPKVLHHLHILDKGRVWREFGDVPLKGLRVGAKKTVEFPDMETLAPRHLELIYEKGSLCVRDLGSINGVFLRVIEPVELVDGSRFRIGSHVLEFRRADPPDSGPAARSEEGEEFFSRDLGALAFLDLIRPDGRPGLRFPITRPDCTIVGRGGPGRGSETHVVLAGDQVVSTQHALIRHEAGRFRLEDLRSSNGTYIRVEGSAPLPPNAVILAGRVLFRVVDSSGPTQAGDGWGGPR